MKGFYLVITCLLLLACSSEKPGEMGSQKTLGPDGGAGKAPAPVIAGAFQYSLRIEPVEPTRDSTFFLIPSGFNLPDAKIQWLVNGAPSVSPEPHQFKSRELKRGDTVQAKAVMQGKELLSSIARIKNAPPEISRVKILPEVFKPGDTLSIDVAGGDSDGDEVSFLYEWTRNGEPAGQGRILETPVKRGDKFTIKVTPFDGESYGNYIQLTRELRNFPPMIVDDRKFNFDGSVYMYQVKASDPDGDSLVYSLKAAPSGMTINNSTGLVTWNVPPVFTGKTSFTVAANDGHKGEATMTFKLTISEEK